LPDREAPSPWWHPSRHRDRRPFLLARARIKAELRRWFEDQGFIEVETGLLQVSPGNETHLHAFATEFIAPDASRRTFYLPTSPEFACKKLLAAGERRIFTFAPAFRNRELSQLHHPAFTMLEWYRAGEPYARLIEDCAAILARAAAAAGTGLLSHRGQKADPAAAPLTLTVAAAMRRFAGIDLLATLGPAGAPDASALAAAARAAGLRLGPDDTCGDVFTRILLERIEPRLAAGRASVLTEYPAFAAALARLKPGDPRVAERFELYACGVEIANGFGELTDAREQRRRFAAEMEEKEARYGERYPLDEELLDALALMPPASGAALGFDRLVMLATGAARIEDVLWTPIVDRRFAAPTREPPTTT
jgi:lysyl-tRNA synthetase class 2